MGVEGGQGGGSGRLSTADLFYQQADDISAAVVVVLEACARMLCKPLLVVRLKVLSGSATAGLIRSCGGWQERFLCSST
jgi:hypothetical protein